MYEKLKKTFTSITSNPIASESGIYPHPYCRATADNLNGIAVASAFNWVINRK